MSPVGDVITRPTPRQMEDRIARSLFWIVWLRGAMQLVSFLTTLVIARLLAPADYGLMALAVVWTPVSRASRSWAWEPPSCNSPIWRSASSYVLLAGRGDDGSGTSPCMLPRRPSQRGSPFRPSPDVLRVAGLSLPLVAIRTVPDALLRKRLELNRISQARRPRSSWGCPWFSVLAWSGAGVWALVAGTLVMPLVQNIVSFWFVGWRPGLRIGAGASREILRYSLRSSEARVGWAVYQQIDAVVLGKISGQTVLGIYSMAKVLATLPVTRSPSLQTSSPSRSWRATDGSQCDARRLPERAATGCLYNRPAVCGGGVGR